MAAGAGGASGASLESSLERRFRGVSNTMDSIQGLSTWCIENKKYHSLIVRHWMKCLRKSADTSHRQNLFYVANDVIQNCKRKNAIVYRTAFAEMLPDAFLLVNNEGDLKVIKSVERILSIWEDRGVYSGTLITELRSTLVKEESPPETPVEQKTPVESKADLQSKVVAEFVPQALFDQLSRYKKSLEEVDLREKQLAAMRIDICSTDALKRLKDKAGGKKFSKDFEEGSAQLQEFVKFFDRQMKTGPPLMEALSNADIFYEMQYKEVKIVANAYQTFANRVSHLKRKLDALKANLPDLDDSPIPSPSADAPSPTGSESPFHGLDLADPDPDLDGCAMDDEAEPPAPSPLSSPGGSPKHTEALGEDDNREVEDMELSEEEMDGSCIIVEEQIQNPVRPKPPTSKAESSLVKEKPVKPPVAPPVAPPASLPVAPLASPASLPVAPLASPASPASLPVAPPAAAVESVDLGKIGSILSSLNSVMKNSAPPVESPPPVAPVTPPTSSSLKTPPAVSLAAQDAGSLVNLLSKVDVSPADLLSALSRVKGQGSLEGISSLLSSPATTPSSESGPGNLPASSTSVHSQSLSLTSVTPVVSSQSSQASVQTPNPASALVQALHRDMDLITETEPSSSSESLESKIHSFLQGNPAFNMFAMDPPTNPVPQGDSLSPVTGADTQGGTPVRDEGGGTPTQDEIMDKHTVVPFSSNQSSVGEADAYRDSHQNRPDPSGAAQNGQVYQPYQYGNHVMPEHQAGAGAVAASAGHYQQTPGERAPGGSTQVAQRAQNDQGWYGDAYPEGTSQQPGGYSVAVPGGAGGGGGGEHSTSGLYSYQAETFQEPRDLASEHGATFFRSSLPPVPQLPPPPHVYDAPPPAVMERHQPGGRPDSIVSGAVVHDHQHKSMFHPGDSQFDRPRPEDMRYQDELRHGDAAFYQDEPYRHPDDGYYRGSPPHHPPRGQGCLTPPVSPNEDPYYDYQRHPAPHYAPRRPPPRFEMRHPHPPLRPPRPAHHPRGPPQFPRFHGPDPRLRGKRPGPRGGGYPGPMFPPKRPFLPPRY